MANRLGLSERQWRLLLQTVAHRRMQADNQALKGELAELEAKLETQK